MSGVQREDAVFHEAVAEALQLAWDDFVTDTGCFPDCFTLGPNRTLTADFDCGNFARLVAMWLEPKVFRSGTMCADPSCPDWEIPHRPHACRRCDSSGSIEGPEQGWYEVECPDCGGSGVVVREGAS